MSETPEAGGSGAVAAPDAVGAEEARLEDFATSDLGGAERFVALHGSDVRYCPAHKTWFVYGNARWMEADAGEVVRRMSTTVRATQARALVLPDGDRRVKLLKWALKSESAHAHAAFLRLAESREGISVLPTRFDADPWLFNVVNGTIDLRTGTLRPHRREDLCAKVASVTFDAAAACPRFLRFLDEVFLGDASLIAFVQRLAGYTLTGSTKEQVAVFLHGGGSNGKTTLLELFRLLLGDYAKVTAFGTFLARKHDTGPREDIADLVGARLVTASESPAGRRIDEAVLKQLTGGDSVNARKLYGHPFEFRPQFKLLLAMNKLPKIRDDSNGMWRRVRRIPFAAKFEGAQCDKSLSDKLRDELPGILNWALAGCLSWQIEGLGEPEAVRAATQEYRTAEDHFESFLSERCELLANETVGSGALAKAYRGWCAENHEEALSARDFNAALEAKGPQRDRKGDSRFWRGIALRSECHDDDGGGADPRPATCGGCHGPSPYGLTLCNTCAGAGPGAAPHAAGDPLERVPL